MDHLTKQQRSKNMAAIRNKDTKPEMIVRRGLWKRGFRYRLNCKRLPWSSRFGATQIPYLHFCEWLFLAWAFCGAQQNGEFCLL